jgi:tetratricopeptide (TPR) repeat protein
VGDSIEVKWTVRGKNPEHQGRFFTRYNFGDDNYPIVLDELRVRLPGNWPLRYATSGGRLEPQVSSDGNTRTYHWSVRNRSQLPHDSDLPSREDLRLQVNLSTFASWEEVAAWKRILRQDSWRCPAEVRQVVQQLTRDQKTPLEKARALTYWLRRNIRYVSLGERHDYTPQEPARVWANRYGDCKDTSQLLAVMLEEAGVPVALATLGALDDGQVLPEVPSPWGTHAILLVTLADGLHWIDTTLSLGAWDFLPRGCRDRQCYVTPSPRHPFPLDEKGSRPALRLLRTPPLKPEDNHIEQVTNVWIGHDGSSRCFRTSVYHGSAAVAQRDAWLEVPVGERRRLVSAELQDANSKARLVRLGLNDAQLHDLDQPVRAEIIFDTPGHFRGETDFEGNVTDSKVWSKLISINVDYDREVALDLWAPFESRHRYIFHLPPGMRLDERPRSHTIRSKWGSFTLAIKQDSDNPHELEAECLTRLEKWVVQPEDLEAFRTFHSEVAHHYRLWLKLQPSQDMAEALALEALLALAPDDTAAAAVLTRLFLHHGKTAEAGRVLQAIRRYRPDDPDLCELMVKAASNLGEEEAAYREMGQRFPNDMKYHIALGAVLVDQGKPAEARTVLEPIAARGEGAVRGLAHYHLARGDLCEGHADKALEHLSAAAAANTQSVSTAKALLFKGQVYERLGRTNEAVQAYQQAISVDRHAQEAFLALIQLELAAGQRDAALDHLRRCTLVVGADPEGLLRLADFYLRVERYEDALELAGRVHDQRFQKRAERIRGLVLYRRGNHQQAIGHLEQAQPDAAVLEALLRSCLALGHLRQAEQAAQRWGHLVEPTEGILQELRMATSLVQRRNALLSSIRADPARTAACAEGADHVACAENAWNQGRPLAEVERLLTAAFSDGLEIGPAYGLRGLLAVERGRLSRALNDAERAVALVPQEPLGYLVRGRVRLERGTPGALEDLLKAAELGRRKDAVTLHWLAAALFRQGKTAQALAIQREAVKLRPQDRELREQLEELEKAGKNGLR